MYYFLGELGDALTYALGAGELFDVDEGSEYVDTLLTKAIDEYCSLFVIKQSERYTMQHERSICTCSQFPHPSSIPVHAAYLLPHTIQFSTPHVESRMHTMSAWGPSLRFDAKTLE